MSSELLKKASYLSGLTMLLFILFHSCRHAMKPLLSKLSITTFMEFQVPLVILVLLALTVFCGITHIIIELKKNGGVE